MIRIAAGETVRLRFSVPDVTHGIAVGPGLDIDAPHEAPAVPTERPSAARGASIVERLGDGVPVELTEPTWRRSHSPTEAWASMVQIGLSETEAWDAVAYLWLVDIGEAQLEAAATLYAKNCAACHGETGDGQGPGADALAAQGMWGGSGMDMTEGTMAFADPFTMLGGTGEIYYAKLRRGGMGTGMPGFGPIFTREETWSLVDYVWTFVFE